jgi:lipopolysaccharide heptosyltransferase I
MRRLLFVKTSSLGDVVHNCPAVSDAACAWPDAAIDWVVEEAFADVAAMHEKVQRVIPVAVRRWRSALFSAHTWREIGEFWRALRERHYDRVIDTQGLLKSALLARAANGERHGMDAASAREPLAARFYDVRHAVATAQHAVERNRQLVAAALGTPLPADCTYGLRAEGAPPIELPARYAVLLTMTSRADKLWPEEQWVELGRRLAEDGMPAVLPWGSAEEKARAERIAASVRGAVVPRRLSVAELARVLGRSQGVAGVDTGLTHLAAALGVPAAGIYLSTQARLTGLHAGARTRNLETPDAAAVYAALAGVA